MLSIQQVYALCQPLTLSYITFSNEEFDVAECGNKHKSAYIPKYDMICLNISEIEQNALLYNIPKSRMLLYILLHEIGHSRDPNILTEEDTITLEETAWKIADYLMDKLRLPKAKDYLIVRQSALDTYMKKE
jgi:hypothetical protein